MTKPSSTSPKTNSSPLSKAALFLAMVLVLVIAYKVHALQDELEELSTLHAAHSEYERILDSLTSEALGYLTVTAPKRAENLRKRIKIEHITTNIDLDDRARAD